MSAPLNFHVLKPGVDELLLTARLALGQGSVLNTRSTDDLHRCHHKNAQIKYKASSLQIFRIERHLVRDRQFVTTVDLCPARQARRQRMDTRLSACGHEVVLVEERRARPDKAHVALQDAPQLRQLVETGFPQETANRRQMFCRVREKVGGYNRCIDPHRPEFRHREQAIVAADALGPVKGGSLRGYANREGHGHHRYCQDDGSSDRNNDIKRSFHRHADRPDIQFFQKTSGQ